MENKTTRLQDMTKDELIREVRNLKEQLAQAKNNVECAIDARRSERHELSTEIEFIFDLDLVKAEGVDISQTGIAFSVAKALPVEMRFSLQGKSHHYAAKLVRTQKLKDERYLLALDFVKEVKMPPLPDDPDEDSPITFL